MNNEKLTMSNEKKGAVFHQSLRDFPCPVVLGKYSPSFGLSRFKQGLRFVPPDDEGFSLRGDRRRLLYKGRRRSHRFSILGDCSFEYDCILLREPESNAITLRMEGAENFDFFRQPDFLKEPLLAGSYAVYKKDTLIGEGTGKLCHIHRPEIIDARGRRCWGDLAVFGNELRITIPEWFLSEAVYPVVVDPVIGTSTVGSLITGPDPRTSEYDRPWLDAEYALNKFLVPQNGGGLCNAYVYAYSGDTDNSVIPFLYTNTDNKPYQKKSYNEEIIDVYVFPPSGNIAGWRNNTFEIDGSIITGEYIWFGIWSSFFTTRFDYGGECYKGCFDWETYPEFEEKPTPFIYINQYDIYCTLRYSMYFTYTESQILMRTLTQGVNFSDNVNLKAKYKRFLEQTAQANDFFKGLFIICRKIIEAVIFYEDNCNSIFFTRSIYENGKINDFLRHCGAFFRGLLENAEAGSNVNGGWLIFSKITDTVHAAGSVFKGLILAVRIVTQVFIRDYLLRRFLIAREELVLKSVVSREITIESKIV